MKISSKALTLSCLLTLALPINKVQAEDQNVPPGLVMELLHFARELSGFSKSDYLSPADLTISPDGAVLFVAEYTGSRIDFVNTATGKVEKSALLPRQPTGLTLSPDSKTLYVTCHSEENPMGAVCLVDVENALLKSVHPAGHSPRAPVLSPEGKWLYLANQFSNQVSVFDAASLKQLAVIPVEREPYTMAITPKGDRLVVGNMLPYARADLPVTEEKIFISAKVAIINTETRKVEAQVPLADGSHTIAGSAISSDGRYAFVTHALARYTIVPSKIEQGWITSNGVSVIDIAGGKYNNVLLLDDMDRGAANPWDIAVGDGKIIVTAAGSHELITIEETPVLNALEGQGDLSYKLTFAQPFKKRIQLNVNGPRSLAVHGTRAFAAGYFSDNIDVVDFSQSEKAVTGTFVLQPLGELTQTRIGERAFFDASICHQRWMSCHSCHPFVRTDGLNWDLENDGRGNHKNDKSLVMSHYTPPAMISGVRDSAEIAVRAGIQYILFSTPEEETALAMDEWLKTLRPVPSPHLVNGELSESAKRGKKIFYEKLKCNTCHAPPLYTDMKFHDLGTKGPLDQRSAFDTPTLLENWRTAPYLHDGRFLTLHDLYTKGKHGIYVPVTSQEIDDLVEFNNSL